LLDASETGTTQGEVTTPMPVGSRRPVSMESIDLLAQSSLTQMIADSSTSLGKQQSRGASSKTWLWVALGVGVTVFLGVVVAALNFAK
jgi:hypothetical protein